MFPLVRQSNALKSAKNCSGHTVRLPVSSTGEPLFTSSFVRKCVSMCACLVYLSDPVCGYEYFFMSGLICLSIRLNEMFCKTIRISLLFIWHFSLIQTLLSRATYSSVYTFLYLFILVLHGSRTHNPGVMLHQLSHAVSMGRRSFNWLVWF